MRDVVISGAAESEISVIDEYLTVFGVSTADSLLDAIQDKVAMLEEGVVEFPIAHHPKLAAAGYRVVLVKGYLMLYKVAEDGSVQVAHIFHQS